MILLTQRDHSVTQSLLLFAKPLHCDVMARPKRGWLKRKVAGRIQAVLSSLRPIPVSSPLIRAPDSRTKKYSQRKDKLFFFFSSPRNDKQLLQRKYSSLTARSVYDFLKQLYFWPLHNPQKVFQLENGWDSCHYAALCSQTDGRKEGEIIGQ